MAEPAREHLVPLGNEWDCWTTAALRSTGFPFAWLLRLARGGAPVAFQALEEAERRRGEARRAAAEELSRLLDQVPPEARRGLAKLRDQLSRGAVPAAPPSDAALAACAARVQEGEAAAAAALEGFRAEHQQDALASQGVLRELAADARFREALTWQSRSALQGSVDAFLRRPPGEVGSKTREYERLVARYAQRYCAKNDTIGFFGPIAWVTLGGGGGLSVRPQEPWLRARRVYFEHWCIDELAQALVAADPALRGLAPPRRSPQVRVDGDVLRYGAGRTTALQPAVRRTLELCDGERSAAAVARVVASDAGLEEEEILELLADLAQKKVISWTLDVPGGLSPPEREMETRLTALPAGEPRERALSALRSLCEARDRVAAAAGDPGTLGEAMGALEARFGEITGRRAQRSEGKTYAGRTLVYEDCVRNVRAEAGRTFLDRLGPPLSLVLRSARWFTYQLAERSLAALLELKRSMDAQGAVELLAFYERTKALFPMDPRTPGPVTAKLVEELQAKWSALLALPEGAARVERTASELASGVEGAFEAPGPGWPSARMHAPDVMVAARSAEALERGEGQAVLGEIHAGNNTLFALCLLQQHPDPSLVQAWRALDVPEAEAELLSPREQWARTDFLATSPQDVDVEMGSGMSWRPRVQVEVAADMVVKEVEGRLRVESLRTGRSFDGAAFFGCLFRFESTCYFHPIPSGPHTPRVTVDGLVMARERWRFTPEGLTWASQETPADRFLGAQRWAKAHGLPRFVFLSLPEEPKPFYLDLHAPPLVEVAAQALRKASRASITEMLPAPSELWLQGPEGAHCCELRLVAVDRRPPAIP